MDAQAWFGFFLILVKFTLLFTLPIFAVGLWALWGFLYWPRVRKAPRRVRQILGYLVLIGTCATCSVIWLYVPLIAVVPWTYAAKKSRLIHRTNQWLQRRRLIKESRGYGRRARRRI